MLVLTRQRDEVIMIGDDIEVSLVDIRGDKVRLGITAPKEISVHRKEVYDAIKRENAAAAQVQPADGDLMPIDGAPGYFVRRDVAVCGGGRVFSNVRRHGRSNGIYELKQHEPGKVKLRIGG